MAVEEGHDDAEGGHGEGGPKKSKPKLAILVIVGVLVLVLVGGGAYLFASKAAGKKGDAAKEGKEAAKEDAPKEASHEGGGESKGGHGEGGEKGGNANFVSLEPIIVNLSADEGKRYLKITMQIELTRPDTGPEIQNKMPQIKDAVITVLSSKSAEELLTVDGKFKLKEQLMTRVNSLLTSGSVKNVFFVEFVIQ